MVELVRHALVDGAVNLDVDVIADVVGSEVSGEGDGSLLPEGAREGISGARPQTVTSRHLCLPRVSLCARLWVEGSISHGRTSLHCFIVEQIARVLGMSNGLFIGLFISDLNEEVASCTTPNFNLHCIIL